MTESERYEANIQTLMKTIGAQPGCCRACGVPLWWVKTKNGSSAPFTGAALNHFVDCPKAERFRKQVAGK